MELTAVELAGRLIGKQITSQDARLRFVPRLVYDTAKNYVQETDDVEKTLRYIENAFYIYRGSVCNQMFAPHCKVDGAYEWPAPVKFSWDSIDAVIVGGEHVFGPIPNDGKARIIVDNEEGKLEETIVAFVGQEAITRTEIRDIIPGKDDIDKKLKYNVDENNIGYVFMQDWQNMSLRFYANPIYRIIDGLVKGNIKKDEARGHLEANLEIIKKENPAKILFG